MIAAHADDDILGCGGTMAKHIDSGDSVRVIFLSDGVGSRESDCYKNKLYQRVDSARASLLLLGVDNFQFLQLADNKLDTVALLDIIQPIEKLVSEYNPEILYIHHGGDLNIDHQIASRASLTVSRPVPWSSIREIYSYEVLSSSDWNFTYGAVFTPNVFVDISKYIDIKIKALECYSEELRNPPHARSLENVRALAILRGHTVGLMNAEAFQLIRLLR